MELRVREATDADATFLVGLARAAYRDVVTRQFGAWDDSEQGARFASKLERVPFRIAELDGAPVAAVSSSNLEDHVFLNELLVLPQFQNRGIGSFLLASELANARSLEKPIRLHTLRMNRAIRLYERHGFVVTAQSHDFVDMERAG
jgi:GNAT superfamily N-acetyltransferase